MIEYNSEKLSNLSNLSVSQLLSLTRFKDLVLTERDNYVCDPAVGIQDEMLPEYRQEKIVGKGSFGVAILCRRIADGVLVVLKQINLTESTESEKEIAMNEVEVFSKLHHPNIIGYFGSVIRNNVLIIEMEYADGGTLAQIIRERAPENYLSEDLILQIFEQITSAINYMHAENILHRDLKTANVFLNTKGTVKIGDFGISKIMISRVHAETILGTPYYFSPEMCEGKEYNEKSDIWALGCILCEMSCLKKAFSASNLSELVAKILRGQYIAIPEFYSNSLKHLLRILIQVDSISRPSSNEILKYWIPLLYQNRKKNPFSFADTNFYNLLNLEKQFSNTNMSLSTASSGTLIERSVLYQLKSFGSSVSLIALQLPPLAKIKQVATNGSHFIAVLEDGLVYTWGEGNKGQLGHGTVTFWKQYPSKVEALKQYVIIGACVGDTFSLFLSDTGIVFSCGESSSGCLGHGNMLTYFTPTIIKEFEDIHITQICCGSYHVLALSKDGALFSWGSNKNGALGQQKIVENVTTPELVDVEFSLSKQIKTIFCGPDCSAILLNSYDVYVCGQNADNKLGIGKSFIKILNFKKVELLKKKVHDLCISTNHSAFLIEGGYVITIGNNNEGQRGLGHQKEQSSLTLVTGIKERFIKKVRCYPTYTVVMSDDNIISLWGTRYGIPDGSSSTNNTNDQINQQFQPFMGETHTSNFTNFLASITKSEKAFDPIDILALYSSSEQMVQGRYVQLQDIFPLHQSLLVLVNTTTKLMINY